jgi:hypothetical protein
MIIEITGVTSGQSPYDIFLCNTGGTSCFFVSGNTFIPPNIFIDTEDYFPGEETLLLRLIDTNGCVHDEIQNCFTGSTGTCSCFEYVVVWYTPSILTISYDPCCPSGSTVTETIYWPNNYVFSASTSPNIVSGRTKVVEILKKNDLCPC